MARGTLASTLNRFQSRLAETADFIVRCQTARHANREKPCFKSVQLEWAAEAALLKLVVSSEQLFEATMAMYVAGHRSPSGYRPHRLRNMNISVSDARAIFKGDQDFVGWNDTSAIVKRAERWLKNGEPFAAHLTASSTLLGYVKVMRNVIAHESDEANKKYLNATRRVYGSLPKRVSPGAQLLSPPPGSLAYMTGPTLLDAAVTAYRSIASGIVP